MKYDWKNDLFLFLLLLTIFVIVFLLNGCIVLKSDYDRVSDVAVSALKRNIKLLTTNDSLMYELMKCREAKLFRTGGLQ